jgi:rhodanese-related sulfurtransferase
MCLHQRNSGPRLNAQSLHMKSFDRFLRVTVRSSRTRGVRARRQVKEVAVITVLGLSLGVAVRTLPPLFEGASTNPIHPVLDIGSRATIDGVDFRGSDMNLVIALTPECPYCTSSLPVHRTLADVARQRGVPLTVLVQESDHSSAFIKALDLHYSQLITTDLTFLGIEGTPTVFIVNRDSVIVGIWVGELMPEHERVMVARIEEPNADILTLPGGEPASPMVEDVVLIDVRQRSEFHSGNRSDSINIPLTELQVRAPIELPRTADVILDCSAIRSVDCSIASALLEQDGFDRVRLLNQWARRVFCKSRSLREAGLK